VLSPHLHSLPKTFTLVLVKAPERGKWRHFCAHSREAAAFNTSTLNSAELGDDT